MGRFPHQRYSPLAIGLHWAIAALLMFQLGLGWHMTSMPRSAPLFDAFQFHKSIGITVLVLSLVRVVVRILSPRPRPVDGPRWQRLLASGVHTLLYAFMIGAPLTGWALVSTAPVAIPTLLFHTVPLPYLPLDHHWHATTEAGHWLLAWAGAGLIALHIAGALKHQMSANREEWVIPRMMPTKQVWGGVVLALCGLAFSFGLPWFIYQAGLAPQVGPTVVSSGARVASLLHQVARPAPEPTPMTTASEEGPEKIGDTWVIEPAGHLGFNATVNGSPIEGQFGRWSGKVTYDPAQPKAAKLSVTVNLASASTADQTRDTMLQGPEFFGSSPGGKAVFAADGFHPAGGIKFSADGSLSINGVQVPVTLLFDIRLTGDVATVKGSARLDRIALHVGTGQWGGTDQIGSEVNVQFSLKAHRK